MTFELVGKKKKVLPGSSLIYFFHENVGDKTGWEWENMFVFNHMGEIMRIYFVLFPRFSMCETEFKILEGIKRKKNCRAMFLKWLKYIFFSIWFHKTKGQNIFLKIVHYNFYFVCLLVLIIQGTINSNCTRVSQQLMCTCCPWTGQLENTGVHDLKRQLHKS